MKVLFTGCAGFIEWKVTEALLGAKHSVVGVDNLDDAFDVRLKEWLLSRVESAPGCTFHRLQ